jgi:hypothetical protein
MLNQFILIIDKNHNLFFQIIHIRSQIVALNLDNTIIQMNSKSK